MVLLTSSELKCSNFNQQKRVLGTNPTDEPIGSSLLVTRAQSREHALISCEPGHTSPDTRVRTRAGCQTQAEARVLGSSRSLEPQCHRGQPSIIVVPVGAAVAIARVSSKPAARYSERYSASVRSQPPVLTSIFKS